MSRMPAEHNHILVSETVPSMRYDGKHPFAEWQKEARAKLAELVGMDRFKKCDPDFQLEFTKEFDTFTEYRFTVQSELDYRVPVHFWVPKAAKKPLGAIVCLQGHSKGMHISLGRPKYPGDENTISGGDRDFAVRTVKEGLCAIVIEQRNFGECGGTPEGPTCMVSTMAALLIGRTTIGERVWDTSCVLDAVLEHFGDIVDPEKLYCMGNSGGGTATFYVGCLDERIKIAMPSCAVCTYKDSIAAMAHCTCNFIPHVAEYFDMGDLAGLIAPRKMILVHGIQDPIFPDNGVRETFALTQKMYAYAGVPDNCALVSGPEGHRFYADLSWPVFHKMED